MAMRIRLSSLNFSFSIFWTVKMISVGYPSLLHPDTMYCAFIHPELTSTNSPMMLLRSMSLFCTVVISVNSKKESRCSKAICSASLLAILVWEYLERSRGISSIAVPESGLSVILSKSIRLTMSYILAIDFRSTSCSLSRTSLSEMVSYFFMVSLK